MNPVKTSLYVLSFSERSVMQHYIIYIFSVCLINKNSVNWCANQNMGIPSKTAYLILLLLYLWVKLINVLVALPTI